MRSVIRRWWQVLGEGLHARAKHSLLITAARPPITASCTDACLATGHSPLGTVSRVTATALLLSLLVISGPLYAQSETASISGRVTDPNGGVVPNTTVEAIQEDTNVKATTQTNGDGLYYFASLHPANYRVIVSKDGFKQVIQADVILHVQDALTLNFALQLGSVSESITVTADHSNINTTDASVGTVVDRNFVENIPLNGRSFQSLILLTPGVTAVLGASTNVSGEFSVNGQRTETNYYMVDGVSANSGMTNINYMGGTPGETTLGTTQSLVSIDALQEFRINTSTYSAEYGRTPGAQISFQTRSGTNTWHGSLFDYFRNGALDSNNWFNVSVVARPY